MTYEIKKAGHGVKNVFFHTNTTEKSNKGKTVLHAAGIRESPKISLFLVSG